jgi:hypothetical protein
VVVAASRFAIVDVFFVDERRVVEAVACCDEGVKEAVGGAGPDGARPRPV